MKFHHFGLGVKRFEEAKKFYSHLGYEIGKNIIEKKQKVEIVLCTSNSMPTIELVKPLGKDSPVNNYLKKLNEVFYHSCFEIENLKKIRSFLYTHNAKCVSPPTEAVAFNYRKVSFFYMKMLA